MCIRDSQKTSFELTGGHAAVACVDCHKPAEANKTVSYHFANLSCTTCHADPHRGQFRSRMERIGTNGKAVGCEACHTTKQWNDLARFDHGSTKFALAGAHRAVECIGCHQPPNMERKLLNADFAMAAFNLQSRENHLLAERCSPEHSVQRLSHPIQDRRR